VLERSEHVAEWIRLTEASSSQVVKKGRPGVVHAAEHELGLKRMEGQRAVKIAEIIPEAKEAAREAG
jgi:hypothetical protein